MEKDANQQPQKPQQSAESTPDKAQNAKRGDRPKKPRGRQRQRRNDQQHNNRPKSKPSRPRKRKPRTALDDVRDSFFGCGRCSFFFSAMRANLSLAVLTEMAELSEHGWMAVGWSPLLRELVERSYGCEIHHDTRHFAGSCVECGRMFIVSANDAGQLTYFDIQAQRQAAHLPIDRVRRLPSPPRAAEPETAEPIKENVVPLATEVKVTAEVPVDVPPQTE